MAKVILSDATFEQEVVNEKSLPVLVDFWATWCTPCKVQAPIIDELDQALEGKAKIAKMDVDENPVTPQGFNIMSIPTLVIFKDGKPVWQGVGVHSKSALLSELQKHIA